MSKYSIVGKNLGIRILDPIDVTDEIMLWFNDATLMQYYTNSKNAISRNSLIDAIAKGRVEKNNFTYGIFDLSNDQCIGTLRLGPINLHHKISDLVVLIGNKNYHGKGLAIEAIELGNKAAFELHGLRKLFGGMYASNISSIKAYLRAGWIVEGIRKGQYWNNEKHEDRIEVACFNPQVFNEKYIKDATLTDLEHLLSIYKS